MKDGMIKPQSEPHLILAVSLIVSLETFIDLNILFLLWHQWLHTTKSVLGNLIKELLFLYWAHLKNRTKRLL